MHAAGDSRVGKSAGPNRFVSHVRRVAAPGGIYPTIRGTCYVGDIGLETKPLVDYFRVSDTVLLYVSRPRPFLVGRWLVVFYL